MTARCWISACLFISLVAGAAAQDAAPSKAQKARPKARPVHPSLAPIKEQPGLPRVLLIGDSISMGYTVPVREKLHGVANVVHPPANCGPTSRGVESLEAWLGDKKWNVIHFNFGLHDMVFFGADGTRRVEPTAEGARHQVPLDQYEKNLQTIVARLQKTDAKLIWCSTTPVPKGSAGRLADEAVKFNEVAARVMKEHGVPTNDLHAFAVPRLAEIQLPKNVHFSESGSEVLAGQVAAAIQQALKAGD